MAYVYRAEDRRLGRTVALKVLAPEFSSNEEFRQRFLRESQMAASLDHPNIVPIYSAGESDGLLYIAMRYVEGSDLKAMLATQRLGTMQIVDIFSQVAAALDAAHARGLVHRDVKPANILVSTATDAPGHRHVYLSDFGITKRATTLTGVTAAGVIIGSIDYLAPEQISGKSVSARTDQYALGCAIYQSLTGTVPYIRDDDAALLWAHLVEPLPKVSQQRPDIPAGVDEVLARAMAKDPERRFDTCSAFIAALAAELRSPESPTSGPPTAGLPTAGLPTAGLPTAGLGTTGLGSGELGSGELGSGERGAIGVPPPGDHRDPRDAPAPVHTGRATPVPGRPSGDHAWPPQIFVHSPTAPPEQPRRRRRWVLPVVAAAVAVVVAVAAILLLTNRTPPTTRHTADGLVPVTFNYPATWRTGGTGTTNVIFSPHADAFLTLFSQRSWSDANRALQKDPKGAVGLFTFFISTRSDPQQLLDQLLPRDVTFAGFPAFRQLRGVDAAQLNGVVSDPANPATRVAFQSYTVSVDTPTPRTVVLVFFADEKSFDSHRAQFDRIINSVEFPT
jgi:serine/threonine protein kinase